MIKTKWFTFVVPLVPLEKYRVLFTMQKGTLGVSRATFLSRKLKLAPEPSVTSTPSSSSAG